MSLSLCRRIFLIAAVICIPLRIYLHLTQIDPQTGFYSGSVAISYVFYAVLLVAIAALLFGGTRAPITRPVIATSPFLRVAAVAGAIGLALLSIQSKAALVGPYYMPNPPFLVAMRILGLTVFPLVAAVALLYTAVKSKSSFAHVNGYLSIILDLWMVFFLMSSFMYYTASRHVSDQMLVIVCLALGSLVFIPLGRLCAGVSVQRAARQTIALGLPFALVVFATTAGIVASGPQEQMLSLSLTQSIALMLIAIYVVVLCFSIREESPAVK